jgi:hypothetical protein
MAIFPRPKKPLRRRPQALHLQAALPLRRVRLLLARLRRALLPRRTLHQQDRPICNNGYGTGWHA